MGVEHETHGSWFTFTKSMHWLQNGRNGHRSYVRRKPRSPMGDRRNR